MITACISKLNTNNTNILQTTLTTNETNKILNLSLIFQSQASIQKFNQLKQLNIKKGHDICNNSHENLKFSQKSSTEISCQNNKHIHHVIIDNVDKHIYIKDSINLNVSFLFLVANSVVIGNTNQDNGQTTKLKTPNNASIFVKYHDASDHSLFITNC